MAPLRMNWHYEDYLTGKDYRRQLALRYYAGSDSPKTFTKTYVLPMNTLASHAIAPALSHPQLGLEAYRLGCGRPELRRLLSLTLSNEKQLSQVAARSYVHQLGFEKYVLLESPDGSAVRLHFWPRDTSLAEEDVHSHCASFSSTVVLGRLTSQLYELKPGETHIAYTYRFDRLLGKSEVSGGQPIALAMAAETTFNAGSNYELNHKAMHRVIGVAAGTATVSVWAQRCADAVVVKCLSSRPEDCVRQAGTPLHEVRERLSQIFGMIK